MTDQEAREEIFGLILGLRTGPEYRAAVLLRKQSSALSMASAAVSSREYAAIRLLIGTWDRIAALVKDFSEEQRRQFYRGNPAGLVWHDLEPAVQKIRGSLAPTYAKDFQELGEKYREWTLTRDGQDFRTFEQQAVTALFD